MRRGLPLDQQVSWRFIFNSLLYQRQSYCSIRHSAPDLGINLPIALTQYLQNDLLVSC